MNILLLNPPTPEGKKFIREGRCTQEIGAWGTLWPPISLATIGAVLEKENHRVQLLDCPAENVGLAQLRKRIEDFSPQAVVWSTGTPSIQGDLELGLFVKKINADIRTVIFGTHATVFSEEILREYPAIDAVVRNEPEFTIRELMQTYSEAGGLKEVAGITFRDRDSRVRKNAAREYIDPLDQLPFPAWHLINPDHYRLPLKGDKFLIINPIRGCPFPCTFCTSRIYYGEKTREKSIPAVMSEIRAAIKNFNVREFLVWSETFTLDKSYVHDFCTAILKEGLKFSWACNSRVDTIDESMLRHMAEAGCWMISYGIESGNQDILNQCRKNTRVEAIGPAVKMAKNAGLKVAGHFVFGLPGESLKTMEETAALSRSLDLDFVQYYCVVPFPGTELYDLAKERGWIENTPWENYRQDKAILNFPHLSAKEIQAYRQKAFKAFYLKPSTGIKLLPLLKLKGFKIAFTRVKNFLGWIK